MKTFPKPRPYRWIFFILVLGFLLRVLGVGFGLPFLYHADEPIVVNHALAYGGGDLNPHFFKIPPLVSYWLFIAYGFFYLFGKLSGAFVSPADFEALFYSNPSSFYFIARFLFGVLLGTASIYALYRLILKYFYKGVALSTALIFAVVFLHVRDSHYIYVDIPLVLIMILTFFPILKLLEQNNLRLHLWAGGLIGLATAVKYNGAVLAIPYAIAALSAKKQKTLILVGFLYALLMYSILNPYTWLDWTTFFQEIRQQMGAQGGVDWLHHLQYSLWEGVGPFILTFGLAGLIQSFRHKNRAASLIAIFVLAYYGVLIKSAQPYDRYVLPLVPWIVFLAAYFAHTLGQQKKEKAIILILVLVMAVPNLVKSFRFDQIMMARDNRSIAKEWVETYIPADSKVALGWEFYAPRLAFSPTQLEEKKQEVLAAGGKFSVAQARKLDFLLSEKGRRFPGYDLYFLSKRPDQSGRFLFGRPLIAYDFVKLKEAGVQYVILPITEGMEAYEGFLTELEEKGELLVTLSPYRNPAISKPFDPYTLTGGPFLDRELTERERNGHILRIYKI